MECKSRPHAKIEMQITNEKYETRMHQGGLFDKAFLPITEVKMVIWGEEQRSLCLNNTD